MKYRKKPVVVEAFQMTRERRDDNSEWPEWLHRAWNMDATEPGSCYPVGSGISLAIHTLEGVQIVSWGDYIIQGVKGELYPCKPDIFEMSYAPADEWYTTESVDQIVERLKHALVMMADCSADEDQE